MMKSPRWEAISKIVIAFVNKGHPGYALAALTLMLLGSFAALALLSLYGAHAVSLH
jgi:hypothetical protein